MFSDFDHSRAMGWCGREIWIAMLLALTMLGASPAVAQAGIVGEPIHTCVRRVAPGDTVRSVLADPAAFDCTTRQTAFGPGDYWVLSEPITSAIATDDAMRVRQTGLWQDAMSVYAIDAAGRIAGVHDDGSGITDHLRLGAVVEHRFVSAAAPIRRILWQIEGAGNLRGIVVGARLSDDTQSIRSDLLLASLYSAFIGLTTSLLLYNLALWKALRYDFQLAYCGMLLCLTIYALTSSGALAWIVPDMPNRSRITLSYVALSWATAAALCFSRNFFETRVFDGWLGRCIDVAAAMFFGMGVLFMALTSVAMPALDRVYSLMFMGVPFVVAPVLYRAWRRRSNYLLLFALTWASPIAMVFLRGLYNLNLLPWNFWLDNSTLIVMTSEALLSSLSIAYRIRRLSQERDEAIRREAISRTLADTDPLTGLLNRRAFLNRAITDDSGPRTLMLFDIDHFKLVNDTIGHDGGDEVLRIFAKTLRELSTPDMLIARMGGEEFALLGPVDRLPDPERILAVVRAQRMPFDLRVTTSIGLCHGPLANESDWKALYRMADQALLQAKVAGRDRAGRARTLAVAA
jgi:diguanylate cyclase (GGDEF)-like protein